MRVLIVDNNLDKDCWGTPDLRRFAREAQGATVYVRRAPHDDLPPDPRFFDRIILSGSRTSATEDAPWIIHLHDFIRRAIDGNKPFLGICYGHQSLVRALNGKSAVRKASRPEFGWTEIEVTQPSTLLQNLPEKFFTFSSHFDEVAALPPGMKTLARSQDCEIQACQLEGKPVFGIQFHPEKNLAEAEQSLVERKKKGTPQILLHATEGKKLYNPKLGETIFRNFFLL